MLYVDGLGQAVILNPAHFHSPVWRGNRYQTVLLGLFEVWIDIVDVVACMLLWVSLWCPSHRSFQSTDLSCFYHLSVSRHSDTHNAMSPCTIMTLHSQRTAFKMYTTKDKPVDLSHVTHHVHSDNEGFLFGSGGRSIQILYLSKSTNTTL